MAKRPPERPRPGVLVFDRLPTPIGAALVLTDEDGVLRAFDWEDYEPRMRRLARRHYGDAEIRSGRASDLIRRAVADYFEGDLAALDRVRWGTGGTRFQRDVWGALCTIPPGETWSYAGLAARVGAPSAVRAVGLANGANPVGVVVPCHRVIGSNGTLTGYGGGLHRKRWLLEHEGATLRDLG